MAEARWYKGRHRQTPPILCGLAWAVLSRMGRQGENAATGGGRIVTDGKACRGRRPKRLLGERSGARNRFKFDGWFAGRLEFANLMDDSLAAVKPI